MGPDKRPSSAATFFLLHFECASVPTAPKLDGLQTVAKQR